MIQYFQLTPEILLEYIYSGDPKLNEDGISGNTKDLVNTPTTLLKSNLFKTNYLFFNSGDKISDPSNELNTLSNLVLPLNNSDSQFVLAKNKYQNFFNKLNASNIFASENGRGYMYEDTNYDTDIQIKGDSCDVKYDKCIVHFTSGSYFGEYDSLIFQAYVYKTNKAKFYLASFLFKKTMNLKLKADHFLYNEKLYTTHIEFDIPSVFSIFKKDNEDFYKSLQSQNINLLENSPIGINLYGVNSIIEGNDKYVRLKSLKLKSISIPYIYNRLDDIIVNINEDPYGGDYYIIDPGMKPGSEYPTFVDYIENMGEDIRAYMVMHELQLTEVWVDNNGTPHSEITHKEFHLINIFDDDEDEDIVKKFDAKIKYRPICMKSGNGYRAIITDKIKILNIVDSSSYEVSGSIEIANPRKYGVKLQRLQLNPDGVTRPIVNVYNKKTLDENKLINLSKSGGFVVENNTQNITSFMESTNVGVSIVELSPDETF